VNRQVPNKKNAMRYTLVGDGKVSKHFSQYFSLLGVDFNTWSRIQSNSTLESCIKTSDIVLLLISDSAIENFLKENSYILEKIVVHFSGTLYLTNCIGCHPLMTFPTHLYDLKVYKSIPFVCDTGVDFNTIFPQLNNQWFNMDQSNKVYYHAMCVMAGNFSQTLMRETANELADKLNLPNDILFPYLLQNTKNFIANPKNSATGPIHRSDFTTVKKHLHALKYHPLGDVYQSFVKLNSNTVSSFSYINHKRTLNSNESCKLETTQ